ncbi:hypothetical protein GCM10007893_10630 [Paracoccus marinus]|nr:hypothetical protein GCM10007893_10630 [Paracoccus marinus]
MRGYRPEAARFITTLPTATMPSRLERLDSKYMARSMQSSSVCRLKTPQPDKAATVAARRASVRVVRARRVRMNGSSVGTRGTLAGAARIGKASRNARARGSRMPAAS